MRTIFGIPVSPGIAIGKAFVQAAEGFRIPEQTIDADAHEAEIQRFHTALQFAKEEIIVNRESTRNALGQTFADIFEAQFQILMEPAIHGEMEALIRHQFFSAEHAVTIVMRKHMETFRKIENSYIAEKVNDLRDIEKRLLRHLLGVRKETLGLLSSPVILLSPNLTPSEAANLDKRFILAIVTEQGGAGGHTAILAAALEIPCIVGTGEFLTAVDGGDNLIVDANSGCVIIRPDTETVAKYRRIRDADVSRIESLDAYRDLPAETKDGEKITIYANIEFPYEAENALLRGAEGIGLFRTEFLYLIQDKDPTEDEHFDAYRHVAEVMQGKPVIIRTFDFGDDKSLDRYCGAPERNPALGMRGVRLALKRWTMFRCQLRAILRASAFGDIRVMFPLISTVKEFRQARRTAMLEVMDELSEQGIPFNKNLPIGMMVEVPSAVVMLDKFAEDADFFSIGTNDLTQYTLAVDRGNSNVNHLFQPDDPAVLRLIRRTVAVGNLHSLPVSLCGQVGSNLFNIVTLMGLGLRTISCAPNNIARLKRIIRQMSIADCKSIACTVRQMSSAKDIQDYVKNALRKAAPSLFDPDL
ncbi:MAG: phosphoenolpyruvate--protein phosphotransferase [Planctomycetaceae bacterium]|jgi:phosphotransferase system enzyme I (PtsI)|nr:phosphoenolpyruvate--protein phosphotransferase [Planctomycetaceae bacterium]